MPVSALARRRELAALARILGVSVDEVAHLALEAEALQTVRSSVSAALFDASRPVLKRVAAASRLLPDRSVAAIGEQIFGPLLCARTVGLLAPKHALSIALRMPDGFLADTSSQLDPREAQALLVALPVARVVAVAKILNARGDHLTLARFVEHLPIETIAAVMASIPDEVALFRIAMYVESMTRVGELMRLLSEDRLRALVAALGASAMWIEALELAAALDRGWLRTLGDLAADLDDSVLAAMLESVRATAAWELVLPLVVEMSERSQRRLLALVDDVVLEGLAAAAHRLGMWPVLLPLAERMHDVVGDRLSRIQAN